MGRTKKKKAKVQKKTKNNKKEFSLSRKREVRCESGIDCNNYRVCFDEYGNSTNDNALSYCELYADSELNVSNNSTLDIREKIESVISEYNGVCDSGDFDDFNIASTHSLEQIFQDLWYKNQNKKRLTGLEQKAIEITMRILEIIQYE